VAFAIDLFSWIYGTVPPGSQAIKNPAGTDTLNQNTVGIHIDKVGNARGVTYHHTIINACTDWFFSKQFFLE
jgi:hypothetical protein